MRDAFCDLGIMKRDLLHRFAISSTHREDLIVHLLHCLSSSLIV